MGTPGSITAEIGVRLEQDAAGEPLVLIDALSDGALVDATVVAVEEPA